MAYTVDTSALEKWADPGEVRSSAKSLDSKADSIKELVQDSKNTWDKLRYHSQITRLGEDFYSRFVEINKHGEYVGLGGGEAKTALDSFADGLDDELAYAEIVLGQVALFHQDTSKLDFGDEAAVSDASRSQTYYQGLVDGCQTRYENLETACAEALDGAYDAVVDEGGAIAGPWGSAAFGVAGNATKWIKVSNIKNPVYAYRTPAYDPAKYYNFKKIPYGNSYKMAAYPKPGVSPPVPERYVYRYQNPWTVVDPNTPEAKSLKMPKTIKLGGGILSVVGGVITIDSEYSKEYNRLLNENPEISADELENEAGQAAVVKGGTKILVAAGVGAAIGSVIPGPGTLVGAVVGLVAGVVIVGAMELSGINDWIADKIYDGFNAVVPDKAQEFVGDVGDKVHDAWSSLWD